MNISPSSTPAVPLVPPETNSFLDQCAALALTIFARLQTLVQSPSAKENRQGRAAAMRELDTASRILKRVQESYVSARKAIDAKRPAEDTQGKPTLPSKRAPAMAESPNALSKTKPPLEPLEEDIKSEESNETAFPSLSVEGNGAAIPAPPQNPASPTPQPVPKAHPPFRPPLIRNHKKSARRKGKKKR